MKSIQKLIQTQSRRYVTLGKPYETNIEWGQATTGLLGSKTSLKAAHKAEEADKSKDRSERTMDENEKMGSSSGYSSTEGNMKRDANEQFSEEDRKSFRKEQQ